MLADAGGCHGATCGVVAEHQSTILQLRCSIKSTTKKRRFTTTDCDASSSFTPRISDWDSLRVWTWVLPVVWVLGVVLTLWWNKVHVGLYQREELVVQSAIWGLALLLLGVGAWKVQRLGRERDQAQETLRESEQRNRTLVEDSFDGIFLQKGTEIVFANSRLHEMLGYEPGELIGKEHWIIYHPEDQPLTQARAQARLRGESVIEHYEVRLQSKDGTVLDGEIRAKAFSFEEEAGIQVWVRDISEQKRSTEKFQTLIENVPFGTVIVKEDGTLGYFSPQAFDMFGYAPEDFPDGATWMRKIYPDPDYRRDVIAAWISDMHEAGPGAQRPRVFTVTCRDGTKKHVFFRPVQLRTGEHLMTLEDITDRKRAEEELQRLNRALRTVSECNQALVRAQDEASLAADVCRILVEQGGYRMAWIGLAEQAESKTVRPVAQAGFEDGYLNTANITWTDTESGRGPTGAAIRTGQPVIARDIPVDPSFDPWREAAVQRNYASSAALPLKRDNRVFGALSVYAVDPDAFSDKEVSLLCELADDLAYGITALRVRVEREQAESARRAADQRLVDIIEFLPDATFVIDQEKRIIAWNRACENMTGVQKQALLGKGDYAYAEPFFGERRPILIDLLDLPSAEVEATYKYVSRKEHLIFAESVHPAPARWPGGTSLGSRRSSVRPRGPALRSH